MKSVDESGDDRSYYHGRISREEAVHALTARGFDGSFLLRMSESQDGVYTISVMQGAAVRHIRVINTSTGGYCLSKGDPPEASVWELIEAQMHQTLTNQHNSRDAVALRYPLKSEREVIAPDLLCAAGEAGMDATQFDDDVAAFLEGAVDVKEMVRRRSMKVQSNPHKAKKQPSAISQSLGEDVDPDLERFMNGEITAEELQVRRQQNGDY